MLSLLPASLYVEFCRGKYWRKEEFKGTPILFHSVTLVEPFYSQCSHLNLSTNWKVWMRSDFSLKASSPTPYRKKQTKQKSNLLVRRIDVCSTGQMNLPLSSFAPENLVSRDRFGHPVPRLSAHSPHHAYVRRLRYILYKYFFV